MAEDCRECGLPISSYKQVLQDDPEVCEWCQLAAMGLDEFPMEDINNA